MLLGALLVEGKIRRKAQMVGGEELKNCQVVAITLEVI
jgi:hypothetical protein